MTESLKHRVADVTLNLLTSVPVVAVTVDVATVKNIDWEKVCV